MTTLGRPSLHAPGAGAFSYGAEPVARKRPMHGYIGCVPTLKIASWNINSVRARTALVERLIAEQQPDILCLQETKVLDSIFPAELFSKHGYMHQQLNGQRMHHGVAILSRVPLKDPGKHDWQDNGEARHVGVRLECGIRLENVYVPAGGDTPDRTVNPEVRPEARLHRADDALVGGPATSRRSSSATSTSRRWSATSGATRRCSTSSATRRSRSRR